MAFTKAAEVASLVKRHVLPGVVISLGEAQGISGIEVVIKGFSHPEDGMSRVWHIHLLGQSGMMLDLVIRGLRKAGFEMSGSAPLIRGRLTQILNRAEVAGMRQAVRDAERNKKEVLQKAEIQAAATVAHEANSELEQLRGEVDRLKELIEDMALLPAARGARGPQGASGKDGVNGSELDLDDASLSDLGNVSDERPLEKMVLTWTDNMWRPSKVPISRISNITPGGGGGGGGGGGDASLTIQQRSRDDLSAPPTGTIENISTLSFDTESGFEVQDLGNGSLEAFIKMNSTFNPWQVDGETTLQATGEEPVEFVGGPGVTITTNATTDPKQIIFEASGGAGGGIPEAPLDSRYYVRFNGTWIDLQAALAHLMVGDGGAFRPEGDGGDFAAGTSLTTTDQVFDGGDFTAGTSEATDDQIIEGTDVSSPYFGTTTGPENYG